MIAIVEERLECSCEVCEDIFMRKTQLILIEGLSGSGKSTMAHYLSRQLALHEIEHTWEYEEDKWHPLYPFHDMSSMQKVLDTLATENYHLIIDAALELWQQFADSVQASQSVVILDGCFFGYLTWTMFPFDIPIAEIQAYLARVEEILRPLNPCLIYLYQNDLASAIRRKSERREIDEEPLIRQAIESPYGKRRNLQGFDGMISYWTEYRHFTDTVFSTIRWAKLSIENSASDWVIYQQQVLDLLELSALPELSLPVEMLDMLTGIYSFMEDRVKQICTVKRVQDHLFLDGVPHIWPNNRLIVLSHLVFAVDSFPYKVRFVQEADGTISQMHLTGPEQLFYSVNYIFVRNL